MGEPARPEQIRERLTALRDVILRFHKVLMDSERTAYEKVHGKVGSPGQFLNLLLTDAWFAWLRPYSGLVVAIDERLTAKDDPATLVDAQRFYAEAGRLLTTDERPAYRAALDRDPDIVLAQAEFSRIVAGGRTDGLA
jgi:hypothetical protein